MLAHATTMRGIKVYRFLAVSFSGGRGLLTPRPSEYHTFFCDDRAVFYPSHVGRGFVYSSGSTFLVFLKIGFGVRCNFRSHVIFRTTGRPLTLLAPQSPHGDQITWY